MTSAEGGWPPTGASDRADEPGNVHPPAHETVPHVAPGGAAAPPTDRGSKRTMRAGILAVGAVVLFVAAGVTAAIVTTPSSKSPPKPPAVAPES